MSKHARKRQLASAVPALLPGLAAGARRVFARFTAMHAGRVSVWTVLTGTLVVGGLLAAVLGAQSVMSSETEKARLAFHFESTEIASTLKLALSREEDLVDSASAYATSSPSATPEEFDDWASSVRAIQRYPELENLGLVKYVPASQLKSFEAYIARHPTRPFGPKSVAPVEGFEIEPAGQRPYYCLAVAGFARNLASYIPAGADFCALAPELITGRDTGQASYAPFIDGAQTALGVSTPVYRGGVVPTTVAARRREFVGWLGELLAPHVVLARALEGHPGAAITFRYSSRLSHVSFAVGHAPAHGQTATINLHNGWRVQTTAAPLPTDLLDSSHAVTLLVGGILLSLMFGALVLVLGTGRRRALALVMEKTSELSHQALHDALTGLPNRALVLDRAQQLLARTARNPGTYTGALFIDIDGFKHVNDNLGHAAGDQLLRVVGERLQGAVRDNDTVGRLGGDEFVVLVESTSGQAALNLLADRLTEVLREPVELRDGRKLFSVTASIGVAIGNYETPDALLRDADLALYSAKAAGKDRYALFDASMYEGLAERQELESDLSHALGEDQFFLAYQPIFSLRTGTPVAVEALIRWRHPRRGVVPPDHFIPLAENSGLIIPIGRWVLEHACRQAAAWAARGRQLSISVNVSAQQLGRRTLIEDVRHALAESGLAPELLTLEITETTLTADIAVASNHLEAIRALGVHVAIDDFGTGYASLSQLQRIPVDILKMDRSFLSSLEPDSHGPELLLAIVDVGRALSLRVVAEGVEEEAQLEALKEIGCEMAQGYLLGRPGTPEQIDALLDLPIVARRAQNVPAA